MELSFERQMDLLKRLRTNLIQKSSLLKESPICITYYIFIRNIICQILDECGIDDSIIGSITRLWGLLLEIRLIEQNSTWIFCKVMIKFIMVGRCKGFDILLIVDLCDSNGKRAYILGKVSLFC